jgi:hypothetical protein
MRRAEVFFVNDITIRTVEGRFKKELAWCKGGRVASQAEAHVRVFLGDDSRDWLLFNSTYGK